MREFVQVLYCTIAIVMNVQGKGAGGADALGFRRLGLAFVAFSYKVRA